jgi:hypothetical protein
MKITVEILEANRAALVVERDAHLADAERATGQATAVEGAIRIVDHLLDIARKPGEET